MMGRQTVDQSQLFYLFNLEEQIPADHLLRRLNPIVTRVLVDLREKLAPFYSDIGRPSIDPELMIRMLIVGYCYGIRFERKLCEEVKLHLGYRWFCRLELDDKIPDHSTFSVNRHGRFRDSDILRQVFEAVVRACMDAGLVRSEGFAVDASVIEADASRYHGKAPGELDWSAPERQTRAVAEFLTALDDEGADADRKPPTVISPVDPCSAWTAKANKRVQFGYGLNYLIDLGPHAVIVDVEGTPARTYDEVGWLEGRTVAIEYRWAEGRSERFAEIAAEFVRLKVDVIVTAGTAPALAAKQATSAIPIVFPLAGDPVGNGLVASLPRPGANITGLSLQTTDIGAKRLEVLREVLPKLGRLAILANIGNAAAALEMSEVRDSARNLGLDITTLEVRRAEEIAPAFEALGGRAEALIVCGDPLVTNNRVRIITLALGARLPTMHGSREHVEAGGLMSYGPNFPDLFRRSADYVDKILRGAKPSELPVEQPTRIDLAVNLITAKVLGLTIPQTVLARADEVIE